jgi:hypothetical protein
MASGRGASGGRAGTGARADRGARTLGTIRGARRHRPAPKAVRRVVSGTLPHYMSSVWRNVRATGRFRLMQRRAGTGLTPRSLAAGLHREKDR